MLSEYEKGYNAALNSVMEMADSIAGSAERSEPNPSSFTAGQATTARSLAALCQRSMKAGRAALKEPGDV